MLDCLGRSGKTVVRWLEIAGNSGSGKSSLMNAGLLPLVDEGWLCRKTGFDRWVRIGPMMPGDKPVRMLAEHLANAMGEEMADVRRRLASGDDLALADWLRGRKRKPDADGEAAFLLAIDQFEELFTLSEADEREDFDRLLASALEDLDCPLFVLSTVRADFLDRYEELLPRLMGARFRLATSKTLPPIAGDGLRAVIAGPARLAALEVDEVRDLILSQARDEQGALPLVENALRWLWEQRTGNRLSGALLREAGGIAGLLSSGADDLLEALDEAERERALRLLFRLVRVDPEGRHTRRRLAYAKAVEIAGGGEGGRSLVHRLAGSRVRDGGKSHGSVRLITIGEESGAAGLGNEDGGWVNLIHETLVRARGGTGGADVRPYWPTLWSYVNENKKQSALLERVRPLGDLIKADARAWYAAGRAESLRWSEAYIVQQMREIVEAGEAIEEIAGSGASQAFLGPTNPREIIELLSLSEADDAARGSGRYGERWHLPLGHEARAALAERLAVVGDSRRGVGLLNGLPDIDWCGIDGGEVTIEGRRQIVAPFLIARYPVTIAQFRAFVEDCFQGGRWHLPVGFEEEFPHQDPPRHFASGDSHGAGGVSWHDASAFCHWLGTRLKVEIRLPTEAEWQLAATAGDPERAYPWGRDWDPRRESWRANTSESGLEQTLPVGFYPLGTAPAGLMDMAGNLREWCLEEHNRMADYRVLRGGSWKHSPAKARATYRSRSDPDYRSSSIGFRVVCSSA